MTVVDLQHPPAATSGGSWSKEIIKVICVIKVRSLVVISFINWRNKKNHRGVNLRFVRCSSGGVPRGTAAGQDRTIETKLQQTLNRWGCRCRFTGSVIQLVGQPIEPWFNNSHIPCVLFPLFTHELWAKWPAEVGFSLQCRVWIPFLHPFLHVFLLIFCVGPGECYSADFTDW